MKATDLQWVWTFRPWRLQDYKELHNVMRRTWDNPDDALVVLKTFKQEPLNSYWKESTDPEIHMWLKFKTTLDIIGFSIGYAILLYCLLVVIL